VLHSSGNRCKHRYQVQLDMLVQNKLTKAFGADMNDRFDKKKGLNNVEISDNE
jgi:hypothetical protein